MSSAFVCVWVIAGVFVALSNFCCLLFHFPVPEFSAEMCLSSQKKGGKNHTRQELIFQAANSHSRWSNFFLPKWKDRMKALTLYVVLGGTELMRLFSASGALLCLCVFLSFYFTLFTPLLISPHLPLSIYTGRRRYAQWRAARGLIQFWITFSSSGLVSLVWYLYLPLYTSYSYLACWGKFWQKEVFVLSRYPW